MFHDIPPAMLARMKVLEEINARDRTDGTPHSRRLRQVSPQTGRFLALLAASAPPGQIIEIGTSAGYSTLWLATACRATGRAITTFEVSPEKARLAQETFALAGVEDAVVLVVGDARDHLARYPDVAFCFLDAEKDIYGDCYELVIPNLVRGGLLAADNVTSHRGPLQSMLDRALSDARADAVIVPIGQGVLVCRKA